ncbi:hypothetical protein DPMN_181553 [Dreissena polymorpha]|uniref:Uncharacterized protein n=1 Tax=Dreissena polymorpha TaxID=45954 RepID=A0A9D4I1R7_DREPO|nr:hypothetical protein DPMN_181553 [Dreissena polymorpha]
MGEGGGPSSAVLFRTYSLVLCCLSEIWSSFGRDVFKGLLPASLCPCDSSRCSSRTVL